MTHALQMMSRAPASAFMALPPQVRAAYLPIDEVLAETSEQLDGWLGADELAELERLRDRRRREQWLSGRRLSKRLIAELAGVERFADVQILTRDQRGRGVRPRITIHGRSLDWALSISHSDRCVLAAAAPSGTLRIGVDLARSVPESERFARTWFSAAERRWLQGEPFGGARVLWAIKEAVYKAANDGEGWNPRKIEVLPLSTSRLGCSYRGRQLDRLAVEMRHFDDHVAVLACLAARRVTADETGRSIDNEFNHYFRNAS